MLSDARLLPADVTIETEVCIVGSGPAGITLTRELAAQNIQICLLESGSEELPDPDTKSLGDVEIDGDFVQVTSDNRNRKFGGNSSYWGVNLHGGQLGLRLLPLDDIDFERRDWIPYSGWPFNRDHLVPYYERAQTVLGAGPFAYDVDAWETKDTPRLPLSKDEVTTRVFQFGFRDLFTGPYRDEIAQADNVTTYLHANVVELETDDEGKTINRVRVACLDGKQFWVSAKVFILSAGTIENTHLLLLSNRVHPEGLGNQHGLVGRFFMDHPLVAGGRIYPKDPAIFNQTALYDLRYVRGTNIMGSLSLSERKVRKEQLLNLAVWIFPMAKRLHSPAIASLKALLSSRRFDQGLSGAANHLGNVVGGMGDIVGSGIDKLTKKELPMFPTLAVGGWSHLQPDREKVYGSFHVLHMTEQIPDPENRLVLGSGIDKVGRRNIKLISRWTEADRNGIKGAQDALAKIIADSGLGRYVPARTDDNDPVMDTPGASHHLGTTRMHPNPAHGVVDEHCRVHGVSNLFIASSSVFPTGGYANSTLTIVAIAVRLADHVKKVLAEKVALIQ